VEFTATSMSRQALLNVGPIVGGGYLTWDRNGVFRSDDSFSWQPEPVS